MICRRMNKIIAAVICTFTFTILPSVRTFADSDVKMPLKANYQGHKAAVTSMDFSPDGEMLASGSQDDTIEIHFKDENKSPLELRGHTASIREVLFNVTGDILASCSDDKTIKIWDVDNGSEISTLKGHIGAVNSIEFTADGSGIYSASDDKTVKLWDISSGEAKVQYNFKSAVSSIALDCEDNLLAVGTRDGKLTILNADNFQFIKEIDDAVDSGASVEKVNFSSDGKKLVCSNSRIAQPAIYDVKKEYKKIELNRRQFTLDEYKLWDGCTFSAEGKYLIGCDKKSDHIGIFNFNTGQLVKLINIHPTSFALSVDGTNLAVANLFDDINIYDITDLGDLKLQSIKIELPDNTLRVNEAVNLKLIGHYSDGTDRTVDNEEIKWAVSDKSGAILNDNVLLTKKPGKINITASVSGLNYTVNAVAVGQGSSDEINGIAFDGFNTYIEVGNGGTVRTSTDGAIWIDERSGTENNLNDITYGKSIFTVVGDKGIILTSVDGMIWTLKCSDTKENLKHVDWDGSEFNATGSSILIKSADGEAWEKSSQ